MAVSPVAASPVAAGAAAAPGATCEEPEGSGNVNDSSGEAGGSQECGRPGRPGGGGGNPYPRLRLWCGNRLTSTGQSAVRYVEDWGGDASGMGVEIDGRTIFGPVAAAVYQNGAFGDYTIYPDVQYTSLTVTCIAADGSSFTSSIIYGGTPAVDPIALRDAARARIDIDDPPARANPPFDDPGRFGIVRIPTWLWLDGAYWTPQTETEADGGVTVTVTATPQVARWTPGDGSGEVTCPGPGLVWAPGLADSATDCSHTYLSSSADQPGTRYQLQVAADWEFTWTLNGVDQGAFGTISPTTDLTYQVGEIQAVET